MQQRWIAISSPVRRLVIIIIIIIMWLPTACLSVRHLTSYMDTVSYRSASMLLHSLHFQPTITNQSIAATIPQLLLSNTTCTCSIWLRIPFWTVDTLNGMSDATTGYYYASIPTVAMSFSYKTVVVLFNQINFLVKGSDRATDSDSTNAMRHCWRFDSAFFARHQSGRVA